MRKEFSSGNEGIDEDIIRMLRSAVGTYKGELLDQTDPQLDLTGGDVDPRLDLIGGGVDFIDWLEGKSSADVVASRIRKQKKDRTIPPIQVQEL